MPVSRTMSIASVNLLWKVLHSVSGLLLWDNLWIGLSYSPSWILIHCFPEQAILDTWQWHPPISFCDLLWFGSSSNTKSPTWTFFLVRYHLFRGNRFGTKHLMQHFQNSFAQFWVLNSEKMSQVDPFSGFWLRQWKMMSYRVVIWSDWHTFPNAIGSRI